MEKTLPAPIRSSRKDSLARPADFMMRRAAMAKCPLLLTGETGTGKGYVAQWVHRHSALASGPFVPVNCGAVPDALIDSQLFGHARGAFSGADHEHTGMVRAAAGGTLLLDEVSELPLTAQMRLLRLLEEREVQPVGYSRPVVVDVRVIAATNRDLLAAVRSGRFREDLFFRLNVLHLHLKPLRERSDEISDLLDTFNSEFAAAYGQPSVSFDSEALSELQRYPWPGNVRELRTVIERLHVLRGGGDLVSVDDLRRFGQMPIRPAVMLPQIPRIQEMRQESVTSVLSACRGNVSRAARKLGVHRSTIYRWMAHQPAAA